MNTVSVVNGLFCACVVNLCLCCGSFLFMLCKFIVCVVHVSCLCCDLFARVVQYLFALSNACLHCGIFIFCLSLLGHGIPVVQKEMDVFR